MHSDACVAVGSTWDEGTAFSALGREMRESKVFAGPHLSCLLTHSSFPGLPISTRLGSGILIHSAIKQRFQQSLCHLHLGRFWVGNWDIPGLLSVAGVAHHIRTIGHLSTQTDLRICKEIPIALGER